MVIVQDGTDTATVRNELVPGAAAEVGCDATVGITVAVRDEANPAAVATSAPAVLEVVPIDAVAPTGTTLAADGGLRAVTADDPLVVVATATDNCAQNPIDYVFREDPPRGLLQIRPAGAGRARVAPVDCDASGTADVVVTPIDLAGNVGPEARLPLVLTAAPEQSLQEPDDVAAVLRADGATATLSVYSTCAAGPVCFSQTEGPTVALTSEDGTSAPACGDRSRRFTIDAAAAAGFLPPNHHLVFRMAPEVANDPEHAVFADVLLRPSDDLLELRHGADRTRASAGEAVTLTVEIASRLASPIRVPVRIDASLDGLELVPGSATAEGATLISAGPTAGGAALTVTELPAKGATATVTFLATRSLTAEGAVSSRVAAFATDGSPLSRNAGAGAAATLGAPPGLSCACGSGSGAPGLLGLGLALLALKRKRR